MQPLEFAELAKRKGDKSYMERYLKGFLLALLASAAALFPVAAGRWLMAEQEKPATEEQETKYSEEEYNEYVKARSEPNPEKRGAMLLAFMQKYPKSELLSYVEKDYPILLSECSKDQKYAQLEPLAKEWLKLHPKDVQTIAFVAEAAQKLGHDQLYVDCLLDIYNLQPSPTLAYDIFQVYKKMNNEAKFLEWTEKLFKYPEFDSDFSLRYALVQHYVEAQNYPKAAEYAQATLKSADLIKQPDAMTQEALREVRRACYHVIAMNHYNRNRYAEAIRSFQQALKAKSYGEGHYYIAMCLWKQDQIEEAILEFVKSEILGGATKEKAKENVEQLYKPLHNKTLVGIEKVYRKAKEELGK